MSCSVVAEDDVSSLCAFWRGNTYCIYVRVTTTLCKYVLPQTVARVTRKFVLPARIVEEVSPALTLPPPQFIHGRNLHLKNWINWPVFVRQICQIFETFKESIEY